MIVYSLYKHLFFNYCARARESQPWSPLLRELIFYSEIRQVSLTDCPNCYEVNKNGPKSVQQRDF